MKVALPPLVSAALPAPDSWAAAVTPTVGVAFEPRVVPLGEAASTGVTVPAPGPVPPSRTMPVGVAGCPVEVCAWDVEVCAGVVVVSAVVTLWLPCVPSAVVVDPGGVVVVVVCAATFGAGADLVGVVRASAFFIAAADPAGNLTVVVGATVVVVVVPCALAGPDPRSRYRTAERPANAAQPRGLAAILGLELMGSGLPPSRVPAVSGREGRAPATWSGGVLPRSRTAEQALIGAF
ncbi:MAG: hypothetical protein M3O23_12000 [Actinomycetota bacterium]|nr:hypothetical protein [Actinomycetota bacterium]